MKKLLGIILATGVALGAFAAREGTCPPVKDTAVYSGPFWKTDGFYGDGNEPSASYLKTPEKAPPGHRLSYEIDVPATGWYAPFFKGDPGDQDFFVDDACVAMARTLGKPGADGFAAGPSLWLVKGRRVLRLERLGRRGFPWKKFETMELRRLAPSAASWVFAEKAGHDVVRLGESLRIAVTAGLPDAAADYEIRVAPQNGPDANTWTTLATLSFPHGSEYLF